MQKYNSEARGRANKEHVACGTMGMHLIPQVPQRECTSFHRYLSGDVLHSTGTSVGMHLSGNAPQWECTSFHTYLNGNAPNSTGTSMGMHQIPQVPQWECTTFHMYLNGNVPHPHILGEQPQCQSY